MIMKKYQVYFQSGGRGLVSFKAAPYRKVTSGLVEIMPQECQITLGSFEEGYREGLIESAHPVVQGYTRDSPIEGRTFNTKPAPLA